MSFYSFQFLLSAFQQREWYLNIYFCYVTIITLLVFLGVYFLPKFCNILSYNFHVKVFDIGLWTWIYSQSLKVYLYFLRVPLFLLFWLRTVGDVTRMKRMKRLDFLPRVMLSPSVKHSYMLFHGLWAVLWL